MLLQQLLGFSKFFNWSAGKCASTLLSCIDPISSSIPLFLLKLPMCFWLWALMDIAHLSPKGSAKTLFLATARHLCPVLSISWPPGSASTGHLHLPTASFQTLSTSGQQWYEHPGSSFRLQREGQTKVTKEIKKPSRQKGLQGLRPSPSSTPPQSGTSAGHRRMLASLTPILQRREPSEGPRLCPQPHSFMLLVLAAPRPLLDFECSLQLQPLIIFCCLLPDLRFWTRVLRLTELLHHSLSFWPFWQQLLIVQVTVDLLTNYLPESKPT